MLYHFSAGFESRVATENIVKRKGGHWGRQEMVECQITWQFATVVQPSFYGLNICQFVWVIFPNFEVVAEHRAHSCNLSLSCATAPYVRWSCTKNAPFNQPPLGISS